MTTRSRRRRRQERARRAGASAADGRGGESGERFSPQHVDARPSANVAALGRLPAACGRVERLEREAHGAVGSPGKIPMPTVDVPLGIPPSALPWVPPTDGAVARDVAHWLSGVARRASDFPSGRRPLGRRLGGAARRGRGPRSVRVSRSPMLRVWPLRRARTLVGRG